MNVSSTTVAPSMFTVPCISVLPLSVSISNLVKPAAFCIATSLLSALTVKPSVMVVKPSISAVPLTVTLSSITVSPVEESRVKLPDEVSISDAPATPIRTLSAVMSVDVTA